jgi:endonuclease III
MLSKPAKAAKKTSAKKTSLKKATKKSPPKKLAKKSAVAKPIPANRAAAKPLAAAPSGHGVAKLEIKPARVAEILKILHDTYPNVECALVHTSPWQLLVATILSAQCTDVRVNMVTPKLFAAYPTPAEMAAAPIEAIEEIIRTTGFYHNKAKSIQGAGRVISEQFHGKVPETMAELLTVPGAARKTSSVVLGVAYGKAEGIVVDTHVFRLSRRLGLSRSETPQAVEQDLMKVIPHNRWIEFSHELIHHGRLICEARKPKCAACPLEQLCHAPDKTWHS